MDEYRSIAVSPRHMVTLAREYVALVDRAPSHDYVVRTLAKREAGNMPLMSGDLVIAGEGTRKEYPLAAVYPLHFRKTYFPGRMHGDPKLEFDNLARASELIGVPPPIGYASRVFRSCLIPGKPFDRISPFGVEPDESNVPIAEKLPLAAAAGLWRLAEEALAHFKALHRGGIAHGDAELHNCIVCPMPLELLLIDFESAVRRETLDDEAWAGRCALDLGPLLRESVFLQCALGRQPGALGELAWQRIDDLFKAPDRFRRAIDRQAELGSS